MAIDIHAHLTNDVPAQLARARVAGVTRTVLLPSSVHPEAATTNAELRAEFARVTTVVSGGPLPEERFRNAIADLLAAVAEHPEETVAFVSVPLHLEAGRIREWVADYLTRPNVVGIGELTPAPGRAAAIEPVLAAAAEHGGVPVLTHGFAPNTIDDLRTYRELAERYPSVPLVVGALGGLHALDLVDLAEDRPNLYLDLSSALQTFAVRAAARTVPEQCLFGSNTPYGDVVAARHTVEAAVSDPGVRRSVFEENAARLLSRRGVLDGV
ncbi:amidohydrolase family protein [Nocardia sp. NPDC020380]|uniref:amidohydrolase family protein n=1 Tax=Nocardia sp. NPDC020380 TaxID=3364309 RepID=UPI00379ED2FA